MKYIKRKSPIEEVSGLILDTHNVYNKEENTYSARVFDERLAKKILPTGVFPGTKLKYYGTGSVPNKFIHLNGGFLPVKDYPELYNTYKDYDWKVTIGAGNAVDNQPFDVFYYQGQGTDVGKMIIRAESSNYTPESNIITCKLNGDLVYAERGMTWNDWINSDYNNASLRYSTYTDESTGTTYLYKSDAFIYVPNELSGHYVDLRVTMDEYIVNNMAYNPNPVKFTIDGDSYKSTGGTLWKDWAGTSDAQDDSGVTHYYDESTNTIKHGKNSKPLYNTDGTLVRGDDMIIPDVEYTWINPNASTIAFTIDGTSYEAKEGMTWTEWCDSEYSPSSAEVGTSVVYFSTNNIIQTSAAYVTPSDVITANTAYTTVYYCCFVAGTQVLTTFNGDTCPIEKIKIGDTVVSYNTETGENYLTQVIKTIINPMSTCMAIVEFSNGSKLEMTDYHPIYTKNGWRSITDKNYDKLIIGDIAKTNLGWSEITNIKLYTLKEPIATYTLSVKDFDEIEDIDINDNFYANNVVVHNAGCK